MARAPDDHLPRESLRRHGAVARAWRLVDDAYALVFMVNGIASHPTAASTAVEYVAGSVTSPGVDRAEADVQARNPWTR